VKTQLRARSKRLAAIGLCTSLFVSTACARGGDRNPESVLSDDRLCELWVAQQIHQLTDVWRQRYGLLVACQATEESARSVNQPWAGQGEIVVTVTLANGEDQPSAEQGASAESLLRSALEGAAVRGGFEERYPKRRLQFLP
jgi:hypothetical protein